MWQTILQKITQLNRVTGLEICLLADGKLLVHGAAIRVQKGKVLKEATFQGMDKLEDVFKKIRPGIPLSIVVNGKGVVVKKIAINESTGNPLQAAIPNAQPEDFYCDLVKAGAYTQVAVARKTAIDKLVQAFTEKGYKVLQVSLGFQPVYQVLPFMGTAGAAVIETSCFVLQKDGEGISDFSQRDLPIVDTFLLPEYPVGDQYVHASHLPAFGAALALVTGDLRQPAALNVPSITWARSAYGFYRYYKAGKMALLVTIFALLLISFLFYNHYFQLNRELELTKTFTRNEQLKTVAWKQRIEQKERFLQEAGWLKTGRISFYADRIASLTPSNTLLTSMSIYPLRTNDPGGSDRIGFKQDTIQVAGITDDVVEINQFINNLKIVPAFRLVTMKNYGYRKENQTGQFTLEIITQ